MSILSRLTNPDAQGFSTRFSQNPFTEETGAALTPQGSLRYRLYVPTGVSHPPGIVLLHGIHRDGIEEPRLINFDRALAGAGIEVMTPELTDLADYRVTPATIDTIGDAVVVLGAKMNQAKAGTRGSTLGGGWPLLAPPNPGFTAKSALSLQAAVPQHC